MTVSAQTQDVGEAKESLPVPFTGEALEIGFNPEFLRDGLESVDTDEIALRLISPLRPGLLRSEAEDVLVPDHADPSRGLIVRNVTLRDYRSYASLELELSAGPRAGGRGERRGQDEPARGAPRRDAGLLAAEPQRRAARSLRGRGGADRARRRPRRHELEIELDAPARGREEGEAERRVAAGRRAASRRGVDARLHARPAGRGQRWPGRAPRVLRPGARAAVSGSRLAAGGVRRGRRAAERRPSARGDRGFVARCGRALDGTRRRAGRALVEAPAEAIGRSPRRSPSAPASSASRRRARATRRAARRSRRSRRASTTISSGARPASGRIWTTWRSLAGDRDLRRFGSQGEQRLAVLSLILAEAQLLAERGPAPPLLLLDDVLSELDERRRTALARAAGRARPDADHGDGRLSAAGRAGPARRRSTPGSGEVKPERIGDEVRTRARALRPGRGDDGHRARLARGGRGSDRAERLAGAACTRRNAARRDVVIDLGIRARAARAEAAGAAARGSRRRCARRLCASRPASSPSRSADELETAREAPREPTAEERELAAALAAGIEDESLRKIVAKAAAASLSRAR